MNVLIIDDSEDKVVALRGELESTWPAAIIDVARSFQGALDKLRRSNPNLILLDMTLPTLENADGTFGGRNRLFGGRDILAEIDFECIKTNVILCTQFDTFQGQDGLISLDDLINELKIQFPDIVIGGIYFSHVDQDWQMQLKSLLEAFIREHIKL